ncbi:WW domain-binding protein 4-like [Gigantopelta aegis]|uniref:WW domain-binding protein 4-like n=1 Tax=Gigantopelta aegis TaxID=1735272 RepID=UPI001B88A97D|nr:WW domain-binding protein 4-like [Gigantopelta aegis]
MSDYWISIPRKFCEFCKCWITDNKPSVDFHERGKRHQENVKKKIDDVKKKSLEKAQKDEEMNSDIKKMEQAALEAFRKDLANNPEMAARYAAKLKAAREAEELKEKKSKPSKTKPVDEKTASDSSQTASQEIHEWYEAKSAEGYTYYWSTVTGASVWEAPDSYVSLAEQESKAEEALGKNSPELKSDTSKDQKESSTSTSAAAADDDDVSPDMIPLPVNVPSPSEIPLPSETSLVPASTDNIPAAPEPETPREDPRWARAAYGSWETVKVEEPVYVDLELPQPAQGTEVSDIPLPGMVPSEPKVKFKEKKVVSLGSKDGAPVAFKKRKLGANVRSMRKRDDDDV